MNRKVLKTIIILSWITLFFCFILRYFFFKEMFVIDKDNETLAMICTYLEQNSILRHIVIFPFYLVFNGLYLLSVYKLKWFEKRLLVANIVVIAVFYTLICLFPNLIWLFSIMQLAISPIICSPSIETMKSTIINFVWIMYFLLGTSYIKGIVIWQEIDIYNIVVYGIDILMVELMYYFYNANYTFIPQQIKGVEDETDKETNN